MKKPMIPAVSFIKGISALGVVCCHFFNRMTNMDTQRIMHYMNGYWGIVWVQSFLIVSGFLLHYHYSDRLELKRYAVKRWRSIFPMFYIAYVYFMFGQVCDNHAVFYAGHPWSYLLTLIAMDGYTMNRLPGYYLIGEWFLGVIIILYILYPVLRRAFLKNSIAAFAAVAALYLVFYDKTITNDTPLWTVSSCMMSFGLGMLITCHRNIFTGKWGVLAALVMFVVLQIRPMPFTQNLAVHLMGAALFILLYAAGEKIMAMRYPAKVFQLLGDLSYPIFLLHNRIIFRVSGAWRPGNPLKGWFLFGVTCVLIVMAAKVLDLVTQAVMGWADAKWDQYQKQKHPV